MGTGISIVGLGARTPVGLDSAATAAAVRAAISGIGEHPYFIDKAGEPMKVARDAKIDPATPLAKRLATIAQCALRECLAPLASTEEWGASIPIFLGLPENRPGVPADLGETLAQALVGTEPSRIPLGPVFAFPEGHAAGLLAMGEAAQRIQGGKAELCLVGGADSWIDAERLEWLDAEGQLMSAENRSGFPPGEGAGFCLLASAAAVQRLRLPALAELVSLGSAREPNPMKTETVCIGEGLTGAIREAIAALALPAERIDATLCDLNGERYRNEEFVFAMLRTQLAFADAHNFKHPADSWGDVGAASGPLLAMLAAIAGLKGYAEGRRYLVWCSSENGARAAAVLRLPSSS